MRSWRTLTCGVVMLAVMVGVLGACGDDDGADEPPATTPVPATAPSTTSVTTTPTTQTTPTTAAATTVTTSPPTTAPTSSGWQPVEELPAWAFPPCCADVWKAPGPSPELPAAPDEPLEDGVYFVEIARWSPDDSDQVTLRIHRFERCDRLAEQGHSECDSMWAPDNVAVAPEGAIERDFDLDSSFGVGMTGIDCADGTNFTGELYSGDGPALASLWSALEEDYAEWVRQPLESGTDAPALEAQLAADPASPFKIVCEDYGVGFGLGWEDEAGPQLLFQTLTMYHLDTDSVGPRSPEELLLPASLEVVDGNPVLYLYEGFRS